MMEEINSNISVILINVSGFPSSPPPFKNIEVITLDDKTPKSTSFQKSYSNINWHKKKINGKKIS